jgi:hypothetical protein
VTRDTPLGGCHVTSRCPATPTVTLRDNVTLCHAVTHWWLAVCINRWRARGPASRCRALRISGKEATHIAMEAMKYPPVHISESDNSADGSDEAEVTPGLPTPVVDTPDGSERRKAPRGSGARRAKAAAAVAAMKPAERDAPNPRGSTKF